MTKLELFNTILETTAEVCNVPALDIMNGCKKEDVCVARSIVVFWCNAAGLACQSLLTCIGKTGINSIKSIESQIDYNWVHRFAYHIFLVEVGKRLLEYAHSIGEDFDIEIPIGRLSKHTGKYFYKRK